MASVMLDLDPNDISNVVDILLRFEKKVELAEPIFKLEGRYLEEIARTLPYHQVSYEKALAEVKGVEEWVNVHKSRKVGALWKKYTEGYSRQLSTRDTQAYIEGHEDIVEINQILTNVAIVRAQLNAIVEAIQQMGWMVGHMTKLRIAELQDTIL